MIDAMQIRSLTLGRAYTKVMESFFGLDKTSSSDDMEEEGEEEKYSSSSSNEENKDQWVAIKQIPLDFEQFLSRCHLEKRRRQQPHSFEITPGLSLYVSDNVDESLSNWCVHESRVDDMDSFVTPRPYTLAIADAPYGFCAPNSINDDVKYGVSAYKKVIGAFGKVTTGDSWSLVFFHAHDQITTAEKAFTDSNMTCQMLTWVKPNIHGYKLDRLSWACEFARIEFYSSLGTTTVSALKRGRNVVVVECDPLQVRFIEQRVTALKELPDEFQEVGMKSMAYDPCFFDASEEPQPPIGSEKVEEIVDLGDFEPNNVEAEEQFGDPPHFLGRG
ncbi:hypothetical protein L7F22_001550, partial [Adiantum nelumboides]|nr:hypothetical protein [Adiantum nelumboides]